MGMTESIDRNILLFLEGLRTPIGNDLFLIITYLGSAAFVFIAMFCFGIILLIKNKSEEILLLIGTVAGSSALVFALKEIIGRLRPSSLLSVYTETSFSFPSGHTNISVVFYGVLAYILAQSYTDEKTRATILLGWIFFMIIIGFSRMYLGVHYASDIFGGYALGFFTLALGIILFEKYFDTKKHFKKI